MVRPPQPTHRGGAGTLCVHVVSLCADTKTMTCRPCWDTHILTYQQTDRQTHRHTYINQYKHIVIPIHGCICVTYPPFGWGGGGEPGGAGSYIIQMMCLFMFAKFADITFSLGAEVCSPTRDAICCAPYSPISFYLVRVSWGSRDGCMPSTANCPHIPLIIWEHILTEICLRLKTVGQPLFRPCPRLKVLLPRHVNDAETRGKDCPGYCWKQSRHCWFVPWGGRQDLLAKRMKPWSNGQKRYVHSRKLTWQWKITIFKNRRYIFKWSIFHCHLRFREGKFLPALVRSNPLTPWLGTRACGKTQRTSELNQLNGYIIVGLGWWFGSLRVPLSNNPFHRGIPGIQTTNPNQQWNQKSSGATPKTHFLTFHSLSTSIAFTFTYKIYYHFASSPHSYSLCTDFGEFAPARPKSWEPREIPRQQRLGSGRPYHWWQQASDIPIAGSRHRVQYLGQKLTEGNLTWKKINDIDHGIYRHIL